MADLYNKEEKLNKAKIEFANHILQKVYKSTASNYYWFYKLEGDPIVTEMIAKINKLDYERLMG